MDQVETLTIVGDEILTFIDRIGSIVEQLNAAVDQATQLNNAITQDAGCSNTSGVQYYSGSALGELGAYFQSQLTHISKIQGFCSVCQIYMKNCFETVVEGDERIAQQIAVRKITQYAEQSNT